MAYLYLIASLFCMSTSSIFGAFFNRKTVGKKNPTDLYNLIVCLSAFVGWAILFAINPSFDAGVLLYAVGFGICYIICQIGLINALQCGPVSLTSLILQLSLIGTTVWGFFFWDTPFTLTVALGLVLVVIALWLCLYTGKVKDGAQSKITLKWLIFALMAFLGNIGCSIIQRTQQTKFNGQHGNLLMVCALFVSVIFTLILYLRSDKSDSKVIVKTSMAFPILTGVCNVLLNLFVILLATSPIPPSVVYPVIAVGGLSITSICSLVIFREKLRIWQWFGIAIGAASVVLLSI